MQGDAVDEVINKLQSEALNIPENTNKAILNRLYTLLITRYRSDFPNIKTLEDINKKLQPNVIIDIQQIIPACLLVNEFFKKLPEVISFLKETFGDKKFVIIFTWYNSGEKGPHWFITNYSGLFYIPEPNFFIMMKLNKEAFYIASLKDLAIERLFYDIT